MTLGAADLDAQVSSLVDLYPTYARQYESEKMAGILSILTSVLVPAITPRAIASQSPLSSIVNVFTNPTMTPEQVCLRLLDTIMEYTDNA
jgi:hypothetical protein